MAISSAYVTLTSIALYLHVLVLVTANNGLSVPANVRCSCPREFLVFNCTIMDGGITLWRGTAFNCPSDNDEIILRHSQYASGSASGECNSGAITGHSLQNVVNNRFTSQLNITSSAALNRRSVECAYDDGQQTSRIGISTLTVITDQYQPLEFVRLTAANSEQLTFEWSPVSPGCPAISYTFITSNCGNCSYGTNVTKSVCSPPQLSIVAVECIFIIQSMACGNTFMDPVFVTLKVPDFPNVTYIPQYNTKGDLTKLTLNIIESSFQIAAGLNSSIQFYTWMLSQATVEGPCTTSDNVFDFTCVDEICSFEVIFPLSSCPSRLAQDGVTVSVSATNQLGSGPSSDIHAIDGSNQFVAVTFDPNSNTFTCSFLNQQDASRKLCSLSYGFDRQQLTFTANDSNTSATVSLVLATDIQKERQFFFIVTASNSTYTLTVEGSQIIRLSFDAKVDTIAAVCGTIFGLLIVCIVILVVVVLVLWLKRRQHNNDKDSMQLDTELVEKTTNNADNKQFESGAPPSATMSAHPPMDPCIAPSSLTATPPPLDPSSLTPLPPTDHLSSIPPPARFKILRVHKDCELKEFVESNDLVFKRGCAFYEFTHEVENISANQKIVLMNDKETEEYITGPEAHKKSGVAPGERVQRPHLSKYKVFVQSKGSGARHLSAGSLLLYEAPSSTDMGSPNESLLMSVLKERWQLNELAESLTLEGFCKKHSLNFPSDSVYLDIQILKKCNKAIRDVILQDRSNSQLFTGPKAREIAEQVKQAMESDLDICTTSNNQIQTLMDKWNIFVLCKFPGDLVLDIHTLVLRKNTFSVPKTFDTLQVDRDCVQMSKFVESKGHKFHNGRAYYEFVREEEDILDDTDVVLMDKKTRELLSGPDVRYQIPQAPGIQIKQPNLTEYRVFVQSKSQGSRCLRVGDTVLYNISS